MRKFLLIFTTIFLAGCSSQNTVKEPAVKTPVVTEPQQTELSSALESKQIEIPYEHPVVKIITSKGNMIVELYEDKAPNTVANFISLADSGFYTNMHFHRVIKGFMAQGGCPHSRVDRPSRSRPGTGGPGYTFNNETHPRLRHSHRGIISMANSGPHTNGSQFFILFKRSNFLDGSYNVFGRVIEGMDVLEKIEAIGAQRDGMPLEEAVTFSVQVIQKNDHPYEVKKNSRK